MFRRFSLPLAIVLLVLLGGCGNSRTPVPGFEDPAPAGRMRLLPLPGYGVVLMVPRSWTISIGRPPLLATVSSGAAVVAMWGYRRSAATPGDPASLATTREALLGAARRRDPGLEPIRISAIRIQGRPALELDAVEHVGGQLRRVRSVHVFTSRSELVLDEYAPPSIFHPVDHSVFSPVKRSLRLTGSAG